MKRYRGPGQMATVSEQVLHPFTLIPNGPGASGNSGVEEDMRVRAHPSSVREDKGEEGNSRTSPAQARVLACCQAPETTEPRIPAPKKSETRTREAFH